MAIVFQCECGKEFQTHDEDAGRRARCPVCQRELIVPQPKPVAEGEFAALHDFGPTQTSGKAIASLVLGLCSFFTCLLTGLPAIVFGILGLIDINNPKKRRTGHGFAIAGIVLGSLTSLVVVPAVLLALLLPAVQAAREAARRAQSVNNAKEIALAMHSEAARRAQCVNNEKQIALAMHNYQSANGCFPPAATYDKDGKPLLSWRVLVLPYLERDSLYKQFHLDEPWDSPHNKPLVASMPNVFQCPSDVLPGGMTAYEVVVDPRSMFTGQPAGVQLQSVTDGTSNTLMVAEATNPVPWTKPEDISLAASAPKLGMGSKHPGGFNASMGDGSVRFIRTSLSPRRLWGMVTRNGGEAVTPP